MKLDNTVVKAITVPCVERNYLMNANPGNEMKKSGRAGREIQEAAG